ncbi:MAG: LysR family transcriptional regulator [Thiolinea sp.]
MQTSLPPLNALRVFQLAAKHNSFARAARVLNLTPAAVAYQVRQLEEAVGVQLFDRQARGLSLNQAGIDYWRSTSPILEQIARETTRLTQHYNEQPNTINLCTLHAVAEKWLLPRMAQYRNEQETGINTLAVTTITEDDLNQADICISYQLPPDNRQKGLSAQSMKDFVCIELMRESIVPVCSPLLLQDHHQDMSGFISQTPWLYDIDWEQDWRLWQIAREQSQLKPVQRLNFSLYSLVIDAAIKNMGIAMGRVQLIRNELDQGKLVALYDEPLLLPHAYYIFARREALEQPPVSALFDYLVEK